MNDTPNSANHWVREQLADHEHERWSSYMLYMLDKCERHSDGSLTIPAGYAENLRKQAETLYMDLTPREKDDDRKEADRFLAIMWSKLPPHIAPIVSAMIDAYRENPRGEYYMTLTPEKLCKMLAQNVAEVALAIEYDNDVIGKCGDVGNYIGFILRRYLAEQEGATQQ